MEFIIKDFEGPLDLLLHLIDKSKIDIYDIPINSITDQYIRYLNDMERLNMDITSEFLVMASTLIHIKSNRLLPKKVELEDEKDPEVELINRLIEYKKYKEMSKEFKLMGEKHNSRVYKRQEDLSYLIEDELTLKNISLEDLQKAFNKVLYLNKKFTQKEELEIENLKREEFPVEESMDRVKVLLDEKDEVDFMEVFNYKSSKSEIISLFLAILELSKVKYLSISQRENYGEIYLKKIGEEYGK